MMPRTSETWSGSPLLVPGQLVHVERLVLKHAHEQRRERGQVPPDLLAEAGVARQGQTWVALSWAVHHLEPKQKRGRRAKNPNPQPTKPPSRAAQGRTRYWVGERHVREHKPQGSPGLCLPPQPPPEVHTGAGTRVVTQGSPPVRTEGHWSPCSERSTLFLSQKRDTEEDQHVSSSGAG